MGFMGLRLLDGALEMTTDTTEQGLERLICTALTGHPCNPGAVAPFFLNPGLRKKGEDISLEF
jgi:hypothetical protein